MVPVAGPVHLFHESCPKVPLTLATSAAQCLTVRPRNLESDRKMSNKEESCNVADFTAGSLRCPSARAMAVVAQRPCPPMPVAAAVDVRSWRNGAGARPMAAVPHNAGGCAPVRMSNLALPKAFAKGAILRRRVLALANLSSCMEVRLRFVGLYKIPKFLADAALLTGLPV